MYLRVTFANRKYFFSSSTTLWSSHSDCAKLNLPKKGLCDKIALWVLNHLGVEDVSAYNRPIRMSDQF